MHRGKAGMCRALYFLLGKRRLLLGPSGAVSGLNEPDHSASLQRASAPVSNHLGGYSMNLLQLVNVIVVLGGGGGPKAGCSILDAVQ